MKTIPIIAFLFLSSLCQTCVAAPVQIIGAPQTVAAGQAFAFDIAVPAMTSLSAYQIDITLFSPSGTAGTDFQFGTPVPATLLTTYVFNSSEFFAPAINTDSSSVQRLSLTDFDLTGISTVVGENDQVATVNVLTSSQFTGTLQIAIDANGLILDGPDFATPVPEFTSIQADTLAAAPTSVVITAIPEPASSSLLLVGACAAVVFFRRRIRRKSPRRSSRRVRSDAAELV